MRPLLSVWNGHDLGSDLLAEVSTVAQVQRHPNRILLLREFYLFLFLFLFLQLL